MKDFKVVALSMIVLIQTLIILCMANKIYTTKCVPEVIYSGIVDRTQTPEEHLEEYTSTISKILEFEEGFRAAPYVGKLGYLHIGYGTKLSMSKGLSVEDFPITIDREQAKAWLKKDISKVEASLLRSKSYSRVYKSLSHDRQVVLVSMGYQLGISALFQFKRMWNALGKGDFRLAAHEARDSRWYMQTKNRALRHSRVLEYDNLSGNYSGTL